ncbi:MAG TPA: amidohydrolase [Candidatus Dormibacteraeota bacterium]|nr:amidohydrolase [Candidatus Dormibacteraeota bacterium]
MTITVPAEVLDEVVATRRDLHAHPELAFEEVRTAGIVESRLRALGYEVRGGIATTGVVGILRSGRPGRTILLRADMDGLPIQENNDLPFRSTVPGKMHACGHDTHVAMLLGAARMLMDRRDELAGTLVLCFQPAEEGKGGGREMVREGVLDDPKVDAAFGLHISSNYPTGVVAWHPGPFFASSDSIEITIRGRGGHGASPHESVDPIFTAAMFVASVQQVVSRNISPLQPGVVTIGAIHGGTTHNVIPDSVELLGTVRAFDAEVRKAMPERIERVLKAACEGTGAEYDYTYVWRYPVTANDPVETRLVDEVARTLFGAERSIEGERTMGAEDFSFFLERVPGSYFLVGASSSPETSKPHHNAAFTIDERALETGVQMMVGLGLEAPRRNR